MPSRTIHLIHSECDIHVHRIGPNTVRVRVTEKGLETHDPTDFEIEGNSAYIGEALASVAAVLANLDEFFQQDPN
jgi:cell division septal protein FtsQ